MICVQCMQKLTLLEEAIGIQFKNICLLAKAFTHSSIEWNEVTKYVCMYTVWRDDDFVDFFPYFGSVLPNFGQLIPNFRIHSTCKLYVS